MNVATLITVAFIIVFLIVVAFLIKELFSKENIDPPSNVDDILYNVKSGDFFNNNMRMIGGDNIPEDILKLVKVRWPQVSVLSNAILQRVPLEKFYYSEKTDGEHKNLLIYNHCVYDVTHSDDIKKMDNIDCEKTLILDTELYDNKFYIFDVVYAEKDVSKENFLQRMSYVTVEELGDKFKLKKFNPISSMNSLLEYIQNERSPETGNDIDGVILQRIDTPYYPERGDYYVFKLKPRFLMTVDFMLIYNKDGSYDLYTIGKYQDFLNTLTKKPREVKVIYDADGKEYSRASLNKLPPSMLILFDSPFIPNLSKFKPNRKWNTTGYFKRIIEHADYLINKFEQYPGSFDRKIVEMSLTLDNQWVPIRERDDKRNPNGFKIAQENISLVFDPIRPQTDIYFQKNLTSDDEMQTYVHKINQVFRKFVVETHINPTAKYSSIIDLCGGRGGDELNLYANGIVNFFAVDADATALKQYVDRSYFLKMNYRKGYDALTKTFRKKVGEKGNSFTINALHHALGNKYNDLIADLKSRFEWNGNVDFILCNFAIHYICNDKRNLIALTKFIKQVMDKNGYFIFTYFDGDAILAAAKDGVAEIGPFSIKILKHDEDVTIAKMPLPSIQGTEDIYREEPLVHSSMLKNIGLKLVEDYSIYDRTRNYISSIGSVSNFSFSGGSNIFADLLEYYKLIKVRVYKI